MFWLLLLLLLLAACLGGAFYLVTRFHRFSFIEKYAEKNKKLSWLFSIIPVAMILVLPSVLINIWSGVVIFLHLLFFWICFEILANHMRKSYNEKRTHNIEGGLAIAATVGFMIMGWKLAHTIYRTQYDLQTTKDLGMDRIRILL